MAKSKSILVFVLASIGISVLLYMGVEGIVNNSPTGAFFTFIGTASAVGFGIDVVLHVRSRIRRHAVRKLGGF